MIKAHTFLLSPSIWLGQGTIRFTESSDVLHFVTRWLVAPEEEGIIPATQEIEVEGVAEKMVNAFTFEHAGEGRFIARLRNEALGIIEGTGTYDDKIIAWEFRGGLDQAFEGFEVYELDGEEYSLHAEYASVNQLRTIVDGRLWQES